MATRIAMMGAGAVGSYVGSGLAANGHDVVLIDPWPAHVEAVRSGGMHLSGMTPAESRVVRVPALHVTEAQMLARQRPFDIAFVALKSYDTEWATALIAQY
ncbi:MAG: ketopantoate reductase family protein, partial [Acetobacteraceae bacterium]